jgi:hypothetical protein
MASRQTVAQKQIYKETALTNLGSDGEKLECWLSSSSLESPASHFQMQAPEGLEQTTEPGMSVSFAMQQSNWMLSSSY